MDSLRSLLGKSDLKHLELITEAALSMSGRVTMQGISRWTEDGGSYRTIQRFFGKVHDWSKLRWLLIKNNFGDNLSGTWIITGDEVIVTKSGKETFGLGKFFSSIQNQVVPGLCFLNISLVHVESRASYPLVTEQLVRAEAKETAPKAAVKEAMPKSKGGRPKGSKNKNRTEVTLSAFQLQLKACIQLALNLILDSLTIAYFVYDGAGCD